MARSFELRFHQSAVAHNPSTGKAEPVEAVLKNALAASSAKRDKNYPEGEFRVNVIRCTSDEQATAFMLAASDIVHKYSKK